MPTSRLKQTALKQTSGVNKEPATAQKKPEKRKKTSPSNELVSVNIKIPKSSKQWLSEQAQQVRDNNRDPVPPKERVYPQHLITVAIELLQNSSIDWSQIHNLEELRLHLNL